MYLERFWVSHLFSRIIFPMSAKAQSFLPGNKRKRSADIDRADLHQRRRGDITNQTRTESPVPDAATLQKCSDSWSSFSECLTALNSEMATIELIIYKNQNQHRRTRYWQALRQAHKAVTRASGGLKSLSEADFNLASKANKSSCTFSLGNGSSDLSAKLAAASKICEETAASVLVQSRTLTAQQTGGGFAALMAVLIGSVAQYLYLMLRMRDALDAVVALSSNNNKGDTVVALSSNIKGDAVR